MSNQVKDKADTSEERPLVTFALFAYNQERYIRVAVEGALAQTYSPLEIILSDDCSTDRTFEIMEEMASNYSGPHTLVLNKNRTNQGIGRHVNTVVTLSHGRLLIMAAGDDISMPHRTRELVDVWRDNSFPFALGSNWLDMDKSGLVLDQANNFSAISRLYSSRRDNIASLINNGHPPMHGATAAYSMEIFDLFGPLPDRLVYEDCVATMRALLLGKICVANEHLIKYRSHQNCIYNTRLKYNDAISSDLKARELRSATDAGRFAFVYAAYRRDLQVALNSNLTSRQDYLDLDALACVKVKDASMRSEWWNYSLKERVHYILRGLYELDGRGVKWMVPRILGLSLFCSFRAWWGRTRNSLGSARQ